MINICFYLALAVAFLAGISCFSSKIKSSGYTIYVLVAGVFLSASIGFFPIYKDYFGGGEWATLKSVFLSFHNAIRLFVIDADFTFVQDSSAITSTSLGTLYLAYMSVLFLIAPFFTFGFILMFLRNLLSIIRYKLKFFKEIYVFSELNERSLAFAKDLKNNNKKRVIVFCDVFENNEEKSFELTDEAKKVGAICFKKDIVNVNFKFHSNGKALCFFAIGENPKENINQAIKIRANYGDVPNTHLYVFSGGRESELLLASSGSEKMKIRRVSEAQALINSDLYNNPKKIFSNCITTTERGDKKISAIVVGMGDYGLEMVKTLTWFCQMDGYFVDINAFDKSPSAEDYFKMQCPEIMDEKYNGVYKEGEAYYKVKVYSDVDVETKSFVDKIYQIKDASFVFVCLGSDEMNVKVASNLRMIFERMGIKPIIQAVVYNTELATNLRGVTNFSGQPYDIEFVGDFKSIYSESVIIDSPLEDDALQRHLKYGEESTFWQYEYNYRSSMASAIHMKARIACGIEGADKKEEELTSTEAKTIQVLEHRRWNAYMRAQGYIYSGSKDKSSRNNLGKMHHDLVEFEELSEEEKLKDKKVGTH